MRRRMWSILTGVALGLVAVALIFVSRPEPPVAYTPDPPRAQHPAPYPAENFSLVSHQGREVSLTDFEGRVVALFFGFSHCPDVCPATLANLSRALEEIGPGVEDEVQGILITVDPERDTPERLASYMEAFHPSLLALTGDEEDIRRVADDFGVFMAREGDGDEPPDHVHDGPGSAPPIGPDELPEGAGEGYGVSHTARTFIIDGRGMIVTTVGPFAGPDELMEALKEAAER